MLENLLDELKGKIKYIKISLTIYKDTIILYKNEKLVLIKIIDKPTKYTHNYSGYIHRDCGKLPDVSWFASLF